MSSSQPSADVALNPSAGQRRRKSSDTSEHKMAPVAKQSKTLHAGTFPIDSSNPFSEEVCGSDLVLIVEGKKLHVHKVVLSLFCSYFEALLRLRGFAEANSQEVELKGSECVDLKYDTMVTFLRFFYPGYPSVCIQDDSMLQDMLLYSDYFQCPHVRSGCEAYLQEKVDVFAKSGKDKRWKIENESVCLVDVCLYLWLCETYRIEKCLELFLQAACRRPMKNLQSDKHFKLFSPEICKAVDKRRIMFLEEKLDENARCFAKFKTDSEKCGGCGSGSSYFMKRNCVCLTCGAAYQLRFKHSF